MSVDRGGKFVARMSVAKCGGAGHKSVSWSRISLRSSGLRLLFKRELAARKLSANRLSLDIGVPSGRITDILNARRSITADTAVRLGRYFGNSAQFWLDLQGQYDIAVVERKKGGRSPSGFDRRTRLKRSAAARRRSRRDRRCLRRPSPRKRGPALSFFVMAGLDPAMTALVDRACVAVDFASDQ